MIGSKLLEILKTFSSKEVRRFNEYVSSPFINKNEKISTLLAIISEKHPKLDSKELLKEKLFPLIYPKESFSDQKMRDLMSYLTKMAEDFIAYSNFINNEFSTKLYLLRALRERELFKEFPGIQKSIQQTLKKQKVNRDSKLYLNQYQVNYEMYQYILQTEEGIDQDMSLQGVLNNLDKFYLFTKLKMSSDLFAQSVLYGKSFNSKLLDHLLEYLKDNLSGYEDTPAIVIYYHILLMNVEQKEEHYQKLKAILSQYEHLFSKQEKQIFYANLQNYCAHQLNLGNTQYLQEQYDIYIHQLNEGILFEEQYIPTNAFNNIVNAGLRLGKSEWTLNFIDDYKEKVPKKHRESNYIFNMAKVHYVSKNYSEVLQLLQQVEFTDVYYNLGAKSFLARTYYEIDEIDPLASLLNAFAIYLKRNKKLSKSRLNTHTNFIKYIRKLINLKNKRFKSDDIGDTAKALYKEIDGAEEVVNKAWLLAKTKEFGLADSD